MRRRERVTSLFAALVLVAAPRLAAAETPPPAAPSPAPSAAPHVAESAPVFRHSAQAFIWTTSPVALETGLVLGGGAEVHRALGSRGLFAGARLALGATSEASREWSLTHLHGLASASLGFEKQVGAGLFDVQLGAGALVLRQLGERQQYERLRAAGLVEVRRDSWSFGPWASAEVGVAVAFYKAWRVALRLGPAFTVQQVSGERAARWLLSSGLGVGRAF